MKIKILQLLLVVPTSYFYSCGPIDSKNLPLSGHAKYDSLSQKVMHWLTEHDVPAASVALIEKGEVSYFKTFGQQEPSKPASDSTLFLSASIAKPMTGEIFLRLASQGKVGLDEPMAKYWLDPDLENDDRVYQLTPRHVLTHETGFKNWRYMTDGELRFERSPGTQMGYSGEGFLYLVRFLERKLNKPFNQLAQEVLFDPVGMENASFVKQDWYKRRLAWPKFPDGKWREPVVREESSGAGGLYITANDYARFIISIMNKQGVSDSLRKQQFTIARNQYERCVELSSDSTACPPKLGFGLGWYIYNFSDEQIIGHTGANNGERTLAVFSPERKFGLVIMTNGANGNHVIYKVAEKLGIHSKFIAIEKPDYVRF